MGSIFIKIKTGFLCFLGGVLVVIAFLCGTKSTKSNEAKIENEAEKAKKDTEEYIEKTDSHKLVADSPNSAEHYSRVDTIKQDFFTRLRDRLKDKL